MFRAIVEGSTEHDKKIPIWIEHNKTLNPNDKTSPLIVPPLPNKPITNTSIFSYLWQLAFEYLHEAKKIVIAGYSCPITDSLAMALLSQMKNTRLQEVTIIDSNSGIIDKYRTLMGKGIPQSAVWKYYGDFRDYVKNKELGL